jgi:hypothetical protein
VIEKCPIQICEAELYLADVVSNFKWHIADGYVIQCPYVSCGSKKHNKYTFLCASFGKTWLIDYIKFIH